MWLRKIDKLSFYFIFLKKLLSFVSKFIFLLDQENSQKKSDFFLGHITKPLCVCVCVCATEKHV